MEYIFTIDIGTTSVKCGLFDEMLTPYCFQTAEYALITPDARTVEVHPDIYLQKIAQCIDLMRQFGADMNLVRYVVITTQGETMIPLDASNNPIGNAIVWLDGRAQKEAEELLTMFSEERIYQTTGLPSVDGYVPIAKLMQKTRDGLVAKCLLLEDFIIWQLTGKMVTEKTLLSSTGYFDIKNDCLWTEMLSAAKISNDVIPEALESGQYVGKILPNIAKDLKISVDAEVVTGAMDQICGAVGCGNIVQGKMSETTGTAMVIGATTEKPDFCNPYRITIYRHTNKGRYLMLPICRSAAIIQKWFKDEFCAEETKIAEKMNVSVYEYLAQLAQQSTPRMDGPMLYPYFCGSQTPILSENARGCFVGIGLDTKKNDIIRAIVEGIAFMLRENLEMLKVMGLSSDTLFSLGGASQNRFWCQVKADITGCNIVAAPKLESTSFGAACLASLHAGYYDSLEAAAASYRDYIVLSPQEEMRRLYDEKFKTYQLFAQYAADYYNHT